MWRYQEAHATEDPSTIFMVPIKVDSTLGNEEFSGHRSSTLFLLFGQFTKIGFGELKNVENEMSGDNVALHVAGVNCAFCWH